jgi:hypothetical protein
LKLVSFSAAGKISTIRKSDDLGRDHRDQQLFFIKRRGGAPPGGPAGSMGKERETPKIMDPGYRFSEVFATKN